LFIELYPLALSTARFSGFSDCKAFRLPGFAGRFGCFLGSPIGLKKSRLCVRSSAATVGEFTVSDVSQISIPVEGIADQSQDFLTRFETGLAANVMRRGQSSSSRILRRRVRARRAATVSCRRQSQPVDAACRSVRFIAAHIARRKVIWTKPQRQKKTQEILVGRIFPPHRAENSKHLALSIKRSSLLKLHPQRSRAFLHEGGG
jgi:hypothetical protein